MTEPQYKSYLPALCIALSGLSYYLLLFTNVGNYFHGGGPWGWLVLNVCMVLGVYFSLPRALSGSERRYFDSNLLAASCLQSRIIRLKDVDK